MNRRSFFKMGAACFGTAAAARPASAFVPAHNWDGYNWGTAPPVNDRLYQGPFPQYPPEQVLPGSEIVMATTPSRAVVPGYGMGLVTYVTGDFGGNTFKGVDMEKAIDAFAQLPLGQKLYVRPTWRELQKGPGRLDPDPYWKDLRGGEAVRQTRRLPRPDERSRHRRAGPARFRPRQGADGSAARRRVEAQAVARCPGYLEPRYDHSFFQDAFRELNALLAAELDGSPLVEYMDTFMNYYRQYPEMVDTIARRVGYRVRPSFVWHYEGGDRNGLVIGFANDGIAGVPGVLRVNVTTDAEAVQAGGGLDPGYPLPGKIRQARFELPRGTDWKGLRLKAEIDVKGVRHPVRWACHQALEEDGSLRLRRTSGLG